MTALRNTALGLLSSLALVAAVGCAAERHESIPANARLMVKDSGDVSFAAPSEGTVYVYDRSSGKMLYSGEVNKNDAVNIAARQDKVTVNGRTVMDQQIRDNDEIRVFFREEPRIDRVDTASSTIRVEPAERSTRSDADITVQPKGDQAEIRVRPGANADAKVTVEPGDNGQKVTVEREAKERYGTNEGLTMQAPARETAGAFFLSAPVDVLCVSEGYSPACPTRPGWVAWPGPAAATCGPAGR